MHSGQWDDVTCGGKRRAVCERAVEIGAAESDYNQAHSRILAHSDTCPDTHTRARHNSMCLLRVLRFWDRFRFLVMDKVRCISLVVSRAPSKKGRKSASDVDSLTKESATTGSMRSYLYVCIKPYIFMSVSFPLQSSPRFLYYIHDEMLDRYARAAGRDNIVPLH